MTELLSMQQSAGTREASSRSRHLLITKLRPPRAAVDDVVRPRLLDAIERGADRKLTLIVAPAGYGKSTVAGQWKHRTEQTNCWFSLDESDNDFLVFLEYLVAALQSIDSCICQETARLLESSTPRSGQQLIQMMLNEIAIDARPMVLVLDDYHAISSAEVHDAVSRVIGGMPANMSVIITSRTEPDLPILSMSARGELGALGPDDLSFTRDETAEFLLERQSLELESADVDDIARWSEGWPVALRLLSRVMRGRPRPQLQALLQSLSDNVPSVEDYLWDEVLEARTERWQTFLLQTSILDQCNPELAAAVTNDPNAGAMLSSLARDNFFITRLDGPGNWHRYHQIFSDVLRRRLVRAYEPAMIRQLHARAAAWYGQHGYDNEAASHAIRAEDWSEAAYHLVRICRQLYDRERTVSLRNWLGGLPNQPFEQQPMLAYWLAWAEIRSGHPHEAARAIELTGSTTSPPETRTALQLKVLRNLFDWNADSGLDAVDRLLDQLGPEEAAERSRALVMRALLQETKGDVRGAAQGLEAARALNGRIGIRGLQVLELNVTGGLLLAMGKLHEPADLFRRVIAIGDEWNDLPVQNAHHQLGTILLEWNRPDEASAHAFTTIELAARIEARLHRPLAHSLLCRIAWAAGQWDTALDEIERAIASCAAAGFMGALPVFEEMKCRIWLATDQLTLAQGWLQQIGPETLDSLRYETLQATLTALRVRIHEGRGNEVIDRLQILHALAARHGWGREARTIQTLRAIAEHEHGDPDIAREAMDDALDLGSSEGFLTSYLSEGSRVLPVLRLATEAGRPFRDHAATVLKVAGEEAAPRAALDRSPSILSPRERDVLRLVASGLSNREVAETLFVSEETVKTHLRRVFDKLDVSNRTQAIARLQDLGLL